MWDIPVRTKRLVLAPPSEPMCLWISADSPADAGADESQAAEASLESSAAIAAGDADPCRNDRYSPGPTSIPSSLPGRAANLGNPVNTRYITLNEIDPEEVGMVLNLNAVRFEEPITETPTVGTIEDWVYINMTGDTHPMHSHLVTFQVVGRTPFDVEAYERPTVVQRRARWNRSDSVRDGTNAAADPTERGFKDTVKANPGEFTTIRARYDLPMASLRRKPTFITATSSNMRTTT